MTPELTIDMSLACSRCGKKGATEGGWCSTCISTRKLNASPMKQENLIKVSPDELAKLKSQLSGMVGEYLRLEQEKKAADADWNQRMDDLWKDISIHQARIEGAG